MKPLEVAGLLILGMGLGIGGAYLVARAMAPQIRRNIENNVTSEVTQSVQDTGLLSAGQADNFVRTTVARPVATGVMRTLRLQ